MKTRLTGPFAARVEPLDDFRMVPVSLDRVGLEAVGGFGEQQSHLGLAARAGNAGLAVGDEVRGVHDARLEQRQEAELHRGRVAARIADDARLPDGLAVHLRQAVDRFGEEVGTGVGHAVPLGEDRGILEPEIRGEVDDAHTLARELAGFLHRDAVRRREEHDVAGVEAGVRRVDERQRVPAAQAREHLGDGRSGVLARRDDAHVDVRVLREEPEQFHSRVARAADDPDLDHGFLMLCFARRKTILASGFGVARRFMGSLLGLHTPGARGDRPEAPCMPRSGRRRTTKAAKDGGLLVPRALSISASRTACACAPCGGRPSCAPLRGRRA